jgi:hypothetical protein
MSGEDRMNVRKSRLTRHALWYVQERRKFGLGWSSATYHGERPSARRADGQVTCFRSAPVLVPVYLRDMSLRDLDRFLSPDGEFFGHGETTHRAVAAYLRNPELALWSGDGE